LLVGKHRLSGFELGDAPNIEALVYVASFGLDEGAWAPR
jgi:hypothetical protein